MPAETETKTVSPAGAARSVARGDIPEALRRRYYEDERTGPGLAFYVDPTGKTPAFRDRGRELVTARNDPNAIRDMVVIARHRGWSAITVRGDEAFRREAWLAGRSAGLDVRGYRASERDLQDLERRTRRRDRSAEQSRERRPPAVGDAGAASRLAVIEAVVRSRVADRAGQDRIVSAARGRIVDWLERGARFDVMPTLRERGARVQDRER